MKLEFRVNGAPRSVETRPLRSLLEVLREDLGLTGAKRGCEGGACGACTVLLDGRAVCSCLVPFCQLAGVEITTIEGVTPGGVAADLQDALVEAGATECGFCMPGMVLTASASLAGGWRGVDRETVAGALSGNLCRCTGYVKIMDAVARAARKRGESDAGG